MTSPASEPSQPPMAAPPTVYKAASPHPTGPLAARSAAPARLPPPIIAPPAAPPAAPPNKPPRNLPFPLIVHVFV